MAPLRWIMLPVAPITNDAGHLRLGVPSNLPIELSSFVGRTGELDRCATLLQGSRLLTFSGYLPIIAKSPSGSSVVRGNTTLRQPLESAGNFARSSGTVLP